MPIPHDIPLPLPADRFLLEVAVVFLFLLHILFVNLMVGASTLGLFYEFVGLRRPKYDRLAREVAATITVNKSLAVVLGVAPLLAVNVLYTVYFYSANALTGTAWIAIVPLVSAAFLLGYLHKYSWDRLADNKGLHLTIGATATALFWFVPLIFLTNINLMLFPDRWAEVQGFLSALVLPNVLPRYLHFILASLALTGLFGVGWFGRRDYPIEERLPGFDRGGVRRRFYSVAFGATLLQFVVGPIVYFTLPTQGISLFMSLVILLGIGLAVAFMVVLWREVTAPAESIGRYFAPAVMLISMTVPCMATARHFYRETAIDLHQELMETKTAGFVRAADLAAWRAEHGIQRQAAATSPGEKVFRTACATCHATEVPLIGPPLTEIAEIYRNNPGGIVAWAKAPGRKRTGVPPMPAFAHLGDEKLTAAAKYMLEAGSPEAEAPPQGDSAPAPEPPAPQAATDANGRGNDEQPSRSGTATRRAQP
jgi:cytochrome c